MADVNTNYEWARRRMIKQVAAFLAGLGPDCEVMNLAIFAGYCGVPKDMIREVWADARAMRQREATAS